MVLEGRPNPEHAPAYAAYYFSLSDRQTDLMEALVKNGEKTAAFIRSIPEDKADFQYADGKWSTKSVIAHVIDTERVFQFRALCISRKDTTPLPGFDEDNYAQHSPVDNRTLEDLAAEFEIVRASSVHLFRHLTAGMIDVVGTASNNPLTPRSAGWIIVGHAIHHCRIIAERYLVDTEELY